MKLESVSTQIYLSFNLWISSNALPLLAIVGHWVGDSWKIMSVLLSLRWLSGQYSSENISHTVLTVIYDYDIGQ